MRGLSLRQPPANLRAEMALLGAILSRNAAYERVADFLLPSHFADPANGRIYQRIAERILDGRTADAVSLRSDFESSGILDEVGGVAYLTELLVSTVGINSVPEYGRAIVDTWLRRQLIDVGEKIVTDAFGGEPAHDATAQIAAAERALGELATNGRYSTRLVNGGDAIAEAVADAERAHRDGVEPGVVFGMPTVDKALDGLGEGTLTLLGGMQASGKSAIIGQMGKSLGMRVYDEAIARGLSPEQARSQPGMLFLSLEMSAKEIGLRLAAHEANMNVSDLKKGRLDLESSLRLSQALSRTKNMAMRIHDMVGLPFRLLLPKLIMHLQRQPELVVAIDHLLVLGDDDDKRGGGLDAASVSRTTRQLKALAKRTGVPFIVLTHVPRPPKDGTVRRPVASDVKWAGEGDADNVVFVHRPIMFMDSTPPAQGAREAEQQYIKRKDRWHQERSDAKDLAEIVVAKQRQGPGGVYRMRWDGSRTAFSEWTEKPADELPDWVTEGV